MPGLTPEKNEPPLITVIAVCYNHARFVTQTLNSILFQQYENMQLKIVDDCSTDDSVSVIRKWIQENKVVCTFIEHRENKGLCASLNEIIRESSGKYIKLIACDDILIDGSIRKQIRLLEDSSRNVAMICGNVLEIDEYGNEIQKYFPEAYTFPESENVFRAILKGHEGKSVVIQTPSVLVKRMIYDEVGLYPEDIIQEDFFMWVNVALRFEIIFMNEVYVKYRKISNSLSNDSKNRLRILIDRLSVCDRISNKISESSNQKEITDEKIKIVKKILLHNLSNNNKLDYEVFFQRFIALSSQNRSSNTGIEKHLKQVAKTDVCFANYLVKKYNIRVQNFFLRLYIFFRIPFYSWML